VPEDRRKRALVLIRGGISPISRQYSSILPRRNPERISFEVCAASLRKNLYEANPGFEFTKLAFTWDVFLKERLADAFDLNVVKARLNYLYYPHILVATALNQIRLKPWYWRGEQIQGQRLKGNIARDFSGISQAISISKIAKMGQKYIRESKISFDLFIIVRPDVVLLKPLPLENLPESAVICNDYLDSQGDFRWIAPPNYLHVFAGLFKSILLGQIHKPHVWIRDYFKSLGIDYLSDSHKAGIDEEVLRKTKGSGIPFPKLQEYGLELDEFEKYP
jgi:hypothetical protein